jgi:hypothetical protein
VRYLPRSYFDYLSIDTKPWYNDKTNYRDIATCFIAA